MDYIRSLGLNPEIKLTKHYVVKWAHGSHHGCVVLPCTPRCADSALRQGMQKVRATLRASYA
jgi:hypothetical protein